MKKAVSVLLSAVMLCSFAVPAFAEVEEAPQISVIINGEQLLFGDNIPMSENFRTLVPMRAIFEKLGAVVDWSDETLTATATIGSKVVDVQINRYSINIDGELKETEAPARLIYDKYTYVPLRAVAEAFGADVQWDEDTQTVTILTSPAVISVGNIAITERDFRSYLVEANTQIYNEFIADNNIADKEALAQAFSWNAENTARSFQIARAKAEEDAAILAFAAQNGVTLSDDDNNVVNEYVEQVKTSYGDNYEAALNSNGLLSEADFIKGLKRNRMVSKMKYELSENPDKYMGGVDLSQYVSDETVSAQHVLIAFEYTDKDGNSATRSDAEALALANAVAASAKGGKDFVALMKQYNDDLGEPESGYTFGKGEMVKEFENMSFALKIGEISEPVKTVYGYHVIKRVSGQTEAVKFIRANSAVTVNEGVLSGIPVELDTERPY